MRVASLSDFSWSVSSKPGMVTIANRLLAVCYSSRIRSSPSVHGVPPARPHCTWSKRARRICKSLPNAPRNTGLIVDVKPRLRSPMCVGNRGANGGAPLQAARRLPGNSGVLVRPRERMPEAPGRVLQVGARESKGRTLPQKKRSFRSVSSFAACLAAINDGKAPPRRSWPERTFQC